MFCLNRKQSISPEMSKYIKEQTNKWLKNVEVKSSNNIRYIIVSDLVKDDQPKIPNNFFLIPIVSLITFLAGYKFYKSIY